jgi:predicted dithiol-disulfide oxidoreductase (DUF899 family)
MMNERTTQQIADYRREIAALRQKIRAARAGVGAEPVRDYVFATPGGSVRLTELFGGRSDLVLIHNMGSGCPYCTLWADGFNGVYGHLENRAAFVVSSPDPPETQQRFAQGRGWRFPMVSHCDTSFAADMGYRAADGDYLPGVSIFQRDGDRVLRVSDAGFSPGDDFCALWHIFAMLPDGAGTWRPKFQYG